MTNPKTIPLKLSVLRTVYPPSEDSELLAQSLRIPAEAVVLDLGCGSGIQGITAAQQGADEVWCVDINPNAIKCAKKNIGQNLTRAQAKHTKFIFKKSDLFSDISKKLRFNVIVFNPPYVPSETVQWNDTDGGKKGRETLDRFLDSFENFLAPKGTVYFLQSTLNGILITQKKLQKIGFVPEIIGRQKLFFEELLVFKATQKIEPKKYF